MTQDYMEFQTAAQLIAAIERLAAGIPLDAVYLKDWNGDYLTRVDLQEEKLSDGSVVYNLILSEILQHIASPKLSAGAELAAKRKVKAGWPKGKPRKVQPEQSSIVYKIRWDNDHSCGDLPRVYETEREANQAGRAWKRDMVAMEPTDKERRAARSIYQWEVIETVRHLNAFASGDKPLPITDHM